MTPEPDLVEIIERLRAIPYGRKEGHGTCSTKHRLLLDLLADRPELDVKIVHRIYRIDPEGALRVFGEKAARTVPPEGLVDIHTYATLLIDGRRAIIDVTFPSDEPWDGSSDMPLACGDGTDVPAEEDPWDQKARLVAEHCEVAVREPFIASLST